MPDKDIDQLGELQAAVMEILWRRNEATVKDVQDALPGAPAYTTVLTILRTLEEKGYVGHEAEGRAYRYHAQVERGEARMSAVEHMTKKLFAGSTESLLTHLVSDQALTDEQLERIRALLNVRLGGDEE